MNNLTEQDIQYLETVNDLLSPLDVPSLKEIATTKSVDGSDKLVGNSTLKFPEVNKTFFFKRSK